jgi:hypothetical protein
MATVSLHPPRIDFENMPNVMKNVRRTMDNVSDVRDEAVYRIKRAPLLSVGIAFGSGLLMGAACAAIGRCSAASKAPQAAAGRESVDEVC